MDSDMKWFMILIAAFVIVPSIGLGYSEYHKQDCRVEMARIGKSVEEIKEVCR